MDGQSTNNSTFVSKPFYKWWFNKCFECNKRSFWKPMAKCTGCKHYNHRSCILPDHSVGHVDATSQGCTTVLSNHNANSTSQENVQCYGPTVIIRPGHIIELQMCRCSKSSLAKTTGLNLLGSHQKIMCDSESEEELEEDQPRLVVKRRRLMNTRKMFMRFFSRVQSWPNDEVNAEASIEEMVNRTVNVTAVTCYDEPDEANVENAIEDARAADSENRVDLSPEPELDGVVDRIIDINDGPSVIVADDEIRAAEHQKPIGNETAVECNAAAQNVDNQESTVINEQSPGNATAEEPMTTSVLRDIEGQEVGSSNKFEQICCDDGTLRRESDSGLVIAPDQSTVVNNDTQYQPEETGKLKTSLERDSPTEKNVADEILSLQTSFNNTPGNEIDPDENPRQDDHVNDANQLNVCDNGTQKSEA